MVSRSGAAFFGRSLGLAGGEIGRNGLSTEAVRDAARDVAQLLGIAPLSHVGLAGTRSDVMAMGRQASGNPLRE